MCDLGSSQFVDCNPKFLSSESPILDLDWSATPDGQSILAVGFPHHVDLLCQQRLTYFDETPGWGICHTIDLSRYVNAEIDLSSL
jgi:hypothetical protein